MLLRRLLLLFGMSLGLGSGTALAQGDPEAALGRAIEAAGVPAMGLVVTTATGIEVLEVRGRRSTSDATPVTAEARWHVGSNAKAMVATLALVLARGDGLALDAPVSGFFPDISVHPDLADVPFSALLQHRSGLAANISATQMLAARRTGAPTAEQRAALASYWLTRPPETTPGDFAYSNLGYIIAGAAIEARTGRDWFDLLQAEVLGPLGIASAGLGAPQGDAPEGHRSVFGLMLRPETATSRDADNPPVMGPAGTLHLSLPDYARFLASQLPGGPLLTDAEREVLFALPDPAAELPYALGWARPAHPAGGAVWQHAGSNTLWLVIARLDRDAGRAAAVIANAANGATETALRDLIDVVLPPPNGRTE